MVKRFAGVKGVAFATVVMEETVITSLFGVDQDPGKGGWPTLRYFNKIAGYGGVPYSKLDKETKMCDELKVISNMKRFVEEFGRAIACDVKIPINEEKCDDEDRAFLSELQRNMEDTTQRNKRLHELKNSNLGLIVKTKRYPRIRELLYLEALAGGQDDEDLKVDL